MKELLRFYYKKFYQKLHYDTHKSLMLSGKILSAQNAQKTVLASLDDVEFQVFSQRGEDGIIQYLISKIDIPNPVFVEFGVETYTESNTRFLLMNNNWSGLVIDGSKSNIDFIKQDFVYWKYDLVALQSFITRENINTLISGYTKCEDIGLLSVDIDGNDYWVWESIDCVKPRIVVCEYNSVFGTLPLSVPYDASFVRSQAHYSELYFGASLGAFCHLAEKKGYDFVGTTRAGVNAYFVRKDLSGPFKKYNVTDGYNSTHNRDSKDKDGRLTFLRHEERLAEIGNLPAVDVTTGQTKPLFDWLKP